MRSDHKFENVAGDTEFSGGMRTVGKLGPTEFRYGRNITCRDGEARTRPGLRRAFRVTQTGWNAPFYFNEEDARFTDATHTGFWFPWTFIGSAFGTIQGMGFFRFPNDENFRQIVVSDGEVFVLDEGQVNQITTSETIASTESINFVQADNWLVMFRDDGLNPLRWDGGTGGFVGFTRPGETNQIPKGHDGAWAGNRLWVIKGRDTVYASDVLDIDTYDYVYQQFDINRGDGDEVSRLMPFREDTIVVFKKRSTFYLSGVNLPVVTGDFDADGRPDRPLSDNVAVQTLSTDFGCVARNAVSDHGEQLSFISYKGFTSITRTAENSLLGSEVTISAPIHDWIRRINWTNADASCCGFHDNYVLFAVPLYNSSVANGVFVYDLLLNGGRGGWTGVWDSPLLKPTQFFRDKEKLFFLGTDGAMREMFTDDPWDSEDVFDDTTQWDATVSYGVGAYVQRNVGGVPTIFQANAESLNEDPDGGASWTASTDPRSLYQVEAELWTRFYDHGDEASPKKNSRAQLVFGHRNPTVTVQTEDKDFQTLVTHHTAVTYDRTLYDVNNQAAWVKNNSGLDWWSPHRQDYTVTLVPTTFVTGVAAYNAGTSYIPGDVVQIGAVAYVNILASTAVDPPNATNWDTSPYIIMDASGLDVNAFETHDLRYIPRHLNSNEWAARVKSTTGKIRFKRLISKATQGRFAMHNR